MADASLSEVWERVLEVAGERNSSRALVGPLKLVSVAPGKVSLTADEPGQLAYARQRSEQIAGIFRQALGQAVKVTLQGDEEAEPAPMQTSAIDREALEHPLVKQAVELFGGRVVSVERE
jgi:hypothetical protein